MDFSANTRNHNCNRLGQEIFDLLVIGGGITGAGIAREAVQRGYKVALVEKGDFASGSSGKSSKLIHGGLRYLAALKLGLVFEACNQRRNLLNLAPHLVWPLPFVLPIYQNNLHSLWQIQVAMRLYDILATLSNIQSRHLWPAKSSWPSHQMWSANRTLTREPIFNSHGLLKAARYYDCGTDDARLTLVTLLAAHRMGASLVNYAEVINLLQAGNRITGAQINDQYNGQEIEIQARTVISAAGPWTDRLLKLTRKPTQRWLHLTKGVHLVIRRERLPSQAALTFNSPDDGRYMFLIPWGEQAIIGTTDTNYSSDLDTVCATSADVAYILEAVQHTFHLSNLTENDVVSTYAGLRPLIRKNGRPLLRSRSNHRRSRRHRICEVTPGLIIVAGGKFTTHRTMAREAVNKVAHILAHKYHRYSAGLKNQPQSPLPGGNVDDWHTYQVQQQSAIIAETGLSAVVVKHLIATYGTEAIHLLPLLAQKPTLAERITPDLPVIKAQIIHAIRYEMALTLRDVLDRRLHIMTRATDQGLDAVESVADLMAAELGWTPKERLIEVATYRHEVTLSRRWRDGSAG
jgi:glycerol-3-phosphate dehydrogenase